MKDQKGDSVPWFNNKCAVEQLMPNLPHMDQKPNNRRTAAIEED